jgi:hypothetical protein
MYIYSPLENKYTKWYNNITRSAKNRGWQKTDITFYTENHHIIPRSLSGSNDPDNLVLLTPKEHFICHLLLSKMFVGDEKRKMCVAIYLMASKELKLKSSTYKVVREEYSKIQKNKTHTQESKDKIGKHNLTRKYSPEFGKKISESKIGKLRDVATKEKISNTLKGTSPWNKGKIVGPQSQEIREKTSIAVKLWWETRRKQLINT